MVAEILGCAPSIPAKVARTPYQRSSRKLIPTRQFDDGGDRAGAGFRLKYTLLHCKRQVLGLVQYQPQGFELHSITWLYQFKPRSKGAAFPLTFAQ